jgi:hypothetical protein
VVGGAMVGVVTVTIVVGGVESVWSVLLDVDELGFGVAPVLSDSVTVVVVYQGTVSSGVYVVVTATGVSSPEHPARAAMVIRNGAVRPKDVSVACRHSGQASDGSGRRVGG